MIFAIISKNNVQMKRVIYMLIKSMQGSFLKKEQRELFDDMCMAQLRDLKYLSIAEDKKNIRGDIKRLNKDFNKAKDQAKIKFGIN